MGNEVRNENLKSQVRCAIYARSASQPVGSIAIEGQIRTCRQFADSKGWQVVEIYVDARVSALSNATRNGFANLQAAISKPLRSIDYVLVEESSRLSRNLVEMMKIAEIFQHYGVGLYFVDQKLDSRDPNFRLFLIIQATVEDQYMELMRKKVSRGMEARALNGFSVGGRYFGYENVAVVDSENLSGRSDHRTLGYKLRVMESEAATVMQIYNLFAEGLSTSQIATKLNDEQVPGGCKSCISADQVHWDSGRVRRILRNPIYVGKQVWNKTSQFINPETGTKGRRRNPPETWICAHVPGLRIVSDELWNKVQNRLECNNPKAVDPACAA
jgi:site-specific DNA recombinase